MILSFKPQFKQPILDGTKIHTIREDPHDRWKRGRKIHQATGVRTKNYDCFNETYCMGVQKIEIIWYPKQGPAVYLNDYTFPFYGQMQNETFGFEQMELLAKNDGFPSVEAFFEWFNKDFDGKIIHFTDYRYK